MPRKARQVESALLTKGFRRADSKHRKFRYHKSNGAETGIRTLLSHGGNREIGDSLLATMARQCRLTRREFERLIDCPLSQEQYEDLLKARGHI